VDGRGVPLSLIVTGANEHDVTQIDHVLEAIMIKRKSPSVRRSKHLCADAGYRGKPALEIIESHGYIPHVVSRNKEAAVKRRDPNQESAALGGRGLPQLVQPIPQVTRAIREA
jgi:transposase